MSGYKRVNYYELCRLCTSTEGTKIHIYKEEGRRRQLPTKIKKCLPLKVGVFFLYNNNPSINFLLIFD